MPDQSMDCGSSILDLATRLWDCTSKRVLYIRHLQKNLNSLKSITEELTNLSNDVLLRVELEEQLRQSKRTHEVDAWLRSVQRLQAEVEEISENGDREIQSTCLGRSCPKNCWSSYKVGAAVTNKIVAVRKLMGKARHFDVVAHRLPPPPVDQRPTEKTVGLDLMFQKVRNCLEDDEVRRIGLYGIGGAGKTTLMKKINNEYFGGTAHDFDVVIWVVVSKPIDTEKIQKVILKKLGTQDQELISKGKEEMAAEIFKSLKAKKFAILLDDMWERLDLLEVGIPTTTKHSSKIVLTTRSERVCDDMEVDQRLKVECLTPNEAFTLFCHKVGKNFLNAHPHIRRLARIVVEECRGLPLALVVIGRSMASRKTPRDWEQAIQQLKSYPARFSGMGDQVFPILKFSYDALDNDTIKSCFLYCSLFPEDYVIDSRDLINLWVGEGFLDEFVDIHEARKQGEEIIRTLKLASLLEGHTSENTCKMHDVIRDMALWLSCNPGEDHKHKNFVVNHVELIEAYEIVKWKEAQRIALWDSNIINLELSPPPCFLNLQTLILRKSNMESLPNGFFQSMPVIRVLDLEDNVGLKELPSEICRLESLEYLNLAITGINTVPVELKNLTKLRCLILGLVPPPSVICCLANLQMFNMVRFCKVENRGMEEVLRGVLEELECLQYLSELSISLSSLPAMKKLLTSAKLQKCLTVLEVNNVRDLKEVELSVLTLQRVWFLWFDNIYDLEHVKIINTGKPLPFGGRHLSKYSNLANLVHVRISKCHQILDLTWLIYAPSLESLTVDECSKMEEIIIRSEEEDQSRTTRHLKEEIEEQNPRLDRIIFSRLREMWLQNLPNLKSIHVGALSFPSLEVMTVWRCPNLRKLPLNYSSACCTTNTLKSIKGESRWWDELEWEDGCSLKSTFTPYFQSI